LRITNTSKRMIPNDKILKLIAIYLYIFDLYINLRARSPCSWAMDDSAL
jgi:hypothetical protein